MSTFKAGDRVRIKVGKHIGTDGFIRSEFRYGYGYGYDVTLDSGRTLQYDELELGLVPPAPKVGDRVRITMEREVLGLFGNAYVRPDRQGTGILLSRLDADDTVEIIAPPLVLPTGKFALIIAPNASGGPRTHILSNKKGMYWRDLTTNKLQTVDHVRENCAKYPGVYRVIFEGE